MKNLRQQLKIAASESVKVLFNADIDAGDIQVNNIRKKFVGDYSVVIFPLVRYSKKSPEQTAEAIGNYLKKSGDLIEDFNVIKGFLNCSIKQKYWIKAFQQIIADDNFGQSETNGKKVVVEYCGPNTNKPLHLGHVRNMVIGYSMASILEAGGYEVHKVNIYNDRGIAICKSMLAWQKYGEGETPDNSHLKGDQLVGKYYVLFEQKYREQVAGLVDTGQGKDEAKAKAPILLETQEMLRKWEAADPEIIRLWKTMNSWVYAGFEDTFKTLGVDFEKNYYESEHYLLGKVLVEEGLKKGAFYRKEDGSVWVDLTNQGMDQKILLRKDGTSVYLTQDLGTANSRYNDYTMDRSVYVVADEQNYHFQVLKATLEKLGKPYASGIYHLSYGMVDLPGGKMKSREGTTVDADDLMQQMFDTARKHTEVLGKIDDFSEEQAQVLYRKLGLGALKFHLLRVNPKKRILFNPEESIEFHGDTGPFIQYTFARIQSILKKWKAMGKPGENGKKASSVDEIERAIIQEEMAFPLAIAEACEGMDPSVIAAYALSLSKTYNRFYNEYPILKADDESSLFFRVQLSESVANIIEKSMNLLGIEVPESM